MNEGEKKAINDFKRTVELYEAKPIDKISVEFDEFDYKIVKIVLNLIEKIQKDNEKLEEINNELEAEKNEAIRRYNFETIPIKKVKDKIEELEEELEIMKVDNMYGRYKEYGGKTKWERLFATKYGMHDALQELTEEREEK